MFCQFAAMLVVVNVIVNVKEGVSQRELGCCMLQGGAKDQALSADGARHGKARLQARNALSTGLSGRTGRKLARNDLKFQCRPARPDEASQRIEEQ